ncbi:methyl-accepting chemotaxis protein [Paenibacillus campi]|uniref:methyl-accepting chemotaxis protein n=1 Tax=Paenibacillus campi TaxID=3106031 RepID=UPI002AFFE599|nr:methyl-accepting chemotaxis protein [Paenibacillus sp. SGZ-1009]
MRKHSFLRLGLRPKLYLIILVPLLLICGLTMWTTELLIQKSSLSTLQQSNQMLATNTIAQLDKNAIQQMYTSAHPEQTPQYKELRQKLNDVRLETGALYVYMFNYADHHWFYTVDGAAADDNKYSPYNDEMTFNSDRTTALLAGQTINTDVATDPQWGDLFSTFMPVRDNAGKIIGYLGIDISAETADSVYATTIKEAYKLVIPIFAIVFVIAVLAAMLFIRRMLKQVSQIKHSMEKVAAGDLTVPSKRVTGDQLGEISDLNNAMIQHITGMIASIQHSSTTLQQSSGYIEQVAGRTLRQTEELSRAIQEITSGAGQQAEQTEQSVEQSARLGHIIDEIGTYVQQFGATAERLTDVRNTVLHEHELLLQQGKQSVASVQQLQQLSSTLAEQSRAAAGISGQVQDIVKQTQILALNASIEASRAGEAGKGFAVVAHEMGQLAQQSGESIREIDRILGHFVEQIRLIHTEFEHSLTSAEQQAKRITECMESFEPVSRVSEDVQRLAHNLSDNTERMQHIRRDVEEHLTHIAATTEETSAMSEQVSASATEQQQSVAELSDISGNLNRLAVDLKEQAEQFVV